MFKNEFLTKEKYESWSDLNKVEFFDPLMRTIVVKNAQIAGRFELPKELDFPDLIERFVSIEFSNCHITNAEIVFDSSCKIEFQSCLSNGKVSFSNELGDTPISSSLHVYNSSINDLIFQCGNIYIDNSDIINADGYIFSNPKSFLGVTNSKIKNCELRNKISLDPEIGCIQIDSCEINRLIISEEGIINSMTILNNTFDSSPIVSNYLIKELKMDHTNYTKNPIYFSGTKVIEGNESTFAFLKKEAYRYQNYSESAFWKKREYDIRLRNAISEKKIVQVFHLGLNSLSNRHGTNWISGIVFTFFIGISGFHLFIFLGDPNLQLGLSIDGFSYIYEKYQGHYFDIFNIVNFSKVSELVPDRTFPFLSSLILTITKILIAYGVYQTAFAFRKYR